jgi:uncharacterized linocin/CFP29 family protein
MNILKKSMAPITDGAWSEINQRIKEVLTTYLTARNFVEIDGPNGFEQGGVSTGRLITPEEQSNEGINYGIREVLPLVEVRKPFELDIWELDNFDRGARDIDLSPLENAAREIAMFEEQAVYYGFKPANIKGLKECSSHEIVTLPSDPNKFLKEIGTQVNNLNTASIGAPYALVINANVWTNLLQLSEGYPILKQLKEIVEGNVIINHDNMHSFLVSERGEDYELVLGNDISCGYDGHNNNSVKLYLTSSFTFRVHNPEAIIVMQSNP